MGLRLFNQKKAQRILIYLMLSVMVFIVIVAVSKPLLDETVKTRNSTALNCGNETITTYTKATCEIVDMGLFYFIGSLIAISIALITGKRTATGIITAIMVFVVVVLLITPLKDLIIMARDASHLNCTSGTISIGAKLSCIVIDIWLFYFVATVVAVAITYIFATKVIPKIKTE